MSIEDMILNEINQAGNNLIIEMVWFCSWGVKNSNTEATERCFLGTGQEAGVTPCTRWASFGDLFHSNMNILNAIKMKTERIVATVHSRYAVLKPQHINK